MARGVYVSAPPASSATVSVGRRAKLNMPSHVHAKWRLTLESLRPLRSETKAQAGACPDRTQAILARLLGRNGVPMRLTVARLIAWPWPGAWATARSYAAGGKSSPCTPFPAGTADTFLV